MIPQYFGSNVLEKIYRIKLHTRLLIVNIHLVRHASYSLYKVNEIAQLIDNRVTPSSAI